VDGNDYIDFVCTWGPAIHGHAYPKLSTLFNRRPESGNQFRHSNPQEVTMAKTDLFGSAERCQRCGCAIPERRRPCRRFAWPAGSPAADNIIKFEGCYHGHVDSLLVKAGSGALTFGHPDSAGVPAAFTQHTIVLPFNDVDAVKAAFAANPAQIAGIILEPVPGNAGLYLPKPGYLDFLRKITAANGALLIFDEVMTGFRLARGGAQQAIRHYAGLELFWKDHRGGLPVGGLRRSCGYHGLLGATGAGFYQAGTLSGNPLAMAAGIAALEELGVTVAAEVTSGTATVLQIRLLTSVATPMPTRASKNSARNSKPECAPPRKSAGVVVQFQTNRFDVLHLLYGTSGR